MEISEAKFKLRDARQARLQSRTMVHSFSEEKFRDVPDKNEYSHVVEALEYLLMDAGENVKIGGEGVYGQPRIARPMPTGPAKFGWSPHDI